MGKLIYGMMVSLDGFTEGPNGELDWHVIDEELHSHFNALENSMSTLLYGRRLYQTMAAYWPTADQNPSASDYEVEYGRIWQAKPKIVFSKTLDKVEWNSRLAREVNPEEISRLKGQVGNFRNGMANGVVPAHFQNRALLEQLNVDQLHPPGGLGL
jgi:dihydrofolate reductase